VALDVVDDWIEEGGPEGAGQWLEGREVGSPDISKGASIRLRAGAKDSEKLVEAAIRELHATRL
jgi:hypothetical protein